MLQLNMPVESQKLITISFSAAQLIGHPGSAVVGKFGEQRKIQVRGVRRSPVVPNRRRPRRHGCRRWVHRTFNTRHRTRNPNKKKLKTPINPLTSQRLLQIATFHCRQPPLNDIDRTPPRLTNAPLLNHNHNPSPSYYPIVVNVIIVIVVSKTRRH